MKYNVLILGASYGSLFATKLLMAGQRVKMVCTKPTAELINREGTVVRFPIKGPSFINLKPCEKMSPSEPAYSLVSATIGPSTDSGG